MNAEWWNNDDGGVFCSNCGNFYDDYWDEPPSRCDKCFSDMSKNYKINIDREYRMSISGNPCYVDEQYYPDWLLEFANELRERRRRYIMGSETEVE